MQFSSILSLFTVGLVAASGVVADDLDSMFAFYFSGPSDIFSQLPSRTSLQSVLIRHQPAQSDAPGSTPFAAATPSAAPASATTCPPARRAAVFLPRAPSTAPAATLLVFARCGKVYGGRWESMYKQLL